MSCLKKAYHHAKSLNWDGLIHGKNRKPQSTTTTRLIANYSGQHSKIQYIMQRYWHLLTACEVVSKYINIYPKIPFRRSCSLKDQLVHSHYFSKIQ